jgi:CHAT domain-containing protein/Tfp pilus assembly protein PilF
VIIGLTVTTLADPSLKQVRSERPPDAALQSTLDDRLLEAGHPIERKLKGGETQPYRLVLATGQFLRVVIDQRGIDVVVTLFAADGKQIIEVDSPNGTQGPEIVSAIAETSGTYRLEVRSLEKDVLTGRYEVKVEELRRANEQDQTRLAARRVLTEAESLRLQGTAETLQQSVAKYQEALSLYRAAIDRGGEAETLSSLGSVFYALGKAQDALDCFTQALLLYRAARDGNDEAATLRNIGQIYHDLGKRQKALDQYAQARPIYHAAGNVADEAATLNEMAVIYEELGEKQKALEKYTAALPLYHAAGNQKAEAVMLNNIAIVLAETGEEQKALDHLARLLPLRRSLGDSKGEAQTLNDMGKLYVVMGEKPKAIEKYKESLSLYRTMGDHVGEAAALNNLGMIHDALGEKDAALDNYAQALTLRHDAGDHNAEAATLNNIGVVYDSRGERQKALEKYNKALSLYRAPQDRGGIAVTLNNIGKVYGAQGKMPEAIKILEQALTEARLSKERLGEAGTLNNLGIIYDELGEKQKALDYYAQALALLHSVEYRRSEAATLNNIGNVYDDLGEKQKALDYYFKALSLMRAVSDRGGQAIALTNLGNVYVSLGKKQQALDDFAQALPLYRAVGDRHGEAATLNHLGGLYDDVGEWRKALAIYAEALPLYRAVEDRSGEAAALNNIGSIYDDAGEKQKALENYAQALTLTRATGNRNGEAVALNNIGAVYYSTGEKQKALDYYMSALSLRRAVGDRRGEATTFSNIGGIYDDADEKQKALDYYAQAISAFESIRTATTIEEIKIGLAEASAYAYERSMLLLLSIKQPESAFDITERARARAFLDQLGNIRPNVSKAKDAKLLQEEQVLTSKIDSFQAKLRLELARPVSAQQADEIASLKTAIDTDQRHLEELLTRIKLSNPEYITLRSVNTLKVAEIQQLLDKDTSLLSYFITPGKTLAFIITKDSFHSVEIQVESERLAAAISSFRGFAELSDLRPESLQQLSNWLIAPLKSYIKTPVVGIVPHGILNYMPFAALTDGNAYFGEQYRLFYLPSASVLKFIVKKDKPGGTQALAVAQSRVEGLRPLDYADEEVETVARLYNTKAFPTGSLSKADFMSRAPNFNIIHLAAHAELNLSNPLFTRIALAPSKNEQENTGDLEVREVYNLDLGKAGLVVLSACETNIGPYSKGDEIVGLNRAFLYAGASTVIASLWTVDDESTSYLMKAFYTSLKQGVSKTEALRAAQAETRKKYPNPYYWAGFVLIGDPEGQ